MSTNQKKQSMYGWFILASAMILQAVVFGVATNMHTQFTSYVVAGENFSLATFNLMFMVGAVVSAIAQPFIGKTYNKFPVKLIFLIGTIVSMGGIMFLSIADKYWMFYLGYTLAQVGIAAVSSLGAPMLISSWFGEKLKGRALGLTFAGGSIGNIFIQSTIVRILSNPAQGYKFAYFWAGLIGLVVGLVVIILFVRMPKDNSEVLGKSDEVATDEKQEIEVWGYTFKEVKAQKFFWVYCVGFIFLGFYVAGLAMNFATYLNAINVAPATVGAVGSVFALSSLIGNVGGGTLFDKLGAKPAMIVAGILVVIADLALLFTPHFTGLAFVFAVTKGFAVYHYMSGPSVLASKLFGNKEFASILAISNIFFAVGYAVGSPLFGAVAEGLSFQAAWIYCLVCIALAFTCLLSSINVFERKNKEKFGK